MHKSDRIVDDSVQAYPTEAWSRRIFREQNRTSQDIGFYRGYSMNITGSWEPERVPALFVTDGMLPILGVTLLLGRSRTRADDPTI
jgi:hypothetical protein